MRVELGYRDHVDFTGRGYATAWARALTQAALALLDVARVEIFCTYEANAISAAIPRRLGYRLARADELPAEPPAHSGRVQIWSWNALGQTGRIKPPLHRGAG